MPGHRGIRFLAPASCLPGGERPQAEGNAAAGPPPPLAWGQSSFLKPRWHAPTGAHCGTVVPACARMQQQKPRSTWPSDQGAWSLAAYGRAHHPGDSGSDSA